MSSGFYLWLSVILFVALVVFIFYEGSEKVEVAFTFVFFLRCMGLLRHVYMLQPVCTSCGKQAELPNLLDYNYCVGCGDILDENDLTIREVLEMEMEAQRE